MATTTNIFATAKKVEKSVKKVAEKEVIIMPQLEDKVAQFNAIKGQLDNLEASKKMLEGDIKELGRKEFCRLFGRTKVKPESFVIQDKEGAKVLFMAVDKYTLVSDEKKEMMAQIAPELVEETTTFGFDPEVLARNLEAISEAIQNSSMSADDKANLIVATQTTSIKKGAIDRLGQYAEVEQMFGLINPICMLKPQKS